MFALRSLFWLTTLTLLLPPAERGDPPPRVNLLHAAYSARILVEDVTGVCARNPDACASSRQALGLLARKLETGAGIVSAGIAAGNALAQPPADRGTLTAADLEPVWAGPDRAGTEL